MNERSAFDILVDYPQKHGLEYDTHTNNKRFYLFPSDPILNTKFVIFKKNNLFFCAHDSFGAKAFMTSTYTGLYGLIDLPESINLKITKKDWLDKFLTSGKRKTGNSYVDRNLTVTSKSGNLPLQMINEKDVKYFLNITEKTNPIKLIVENGNFLPIKELKGKMIVGIETNKWLYEESEIKHFLHYGDLLIKNMQGNASAQHYK